MVETRSSKRRRLTSIFSSHVSSWPDLPAIFESLNDDTLTTVLEFVGRRSYRSFGGTNKRCKEIYLNTKGMTKETFIFGYAPLSAIIDKIEGGERFFNWKLHEALGKGVVFYNRMDVMYWLIEEKNKDALNIICRVAAEEGRIALLEELRNNIDEDENKRYIFQYRDRSASRCGKLNVLKWFETKGLSIAKESCAEAAATGGQLNILQWLQEEKGLQLTEGLYSNAIYGKHLHVMKWLREQKVDWDERTFVYAAQKGNLGTLQWLHDEGCPWPEGDDDYCVHESWLESEVIDWCRLNRYGDRIIFGDYDDY